MNQDEPPRIQQEGRAIQVGEKTTGSKNEPTKSQKRKRRKITFQQGRHNYSPSTWDLWIMAEYRQDLKAFPDWSFFWNEEVRKKKTRARWHALPEEERKAKNRRKPKDPFRRRQKLNEAERRRNAENPHYRTMNSLRARFAKFFKGGKSRSVRRLIGCTLDEFKNHIESKFSNGMTWDNYGSYWHIDHILPCSSFDHTNESQVAACWHWTNMRPLEAKKNLEKSSRIEEPQMSLRIDFAA